jgi:hypothetical protein
MSMSPRLLRPRATGFHPEAQVWRNAVVEGGGSVSTATLKAVSDFCKAIDQASIRSKFRRLNLFCGTSDASLVAVRTPLYRGESRTGTQYGNTLDTNVNFVEGDYAETGASGGLLGNGSSKYLNTGFNVSDLPGAANCHIASYIRGTQDIASARTLLGVLFNSVTDRYRLFLQLSGSSAPNYGIQTELGKAVAVSVVNRTNTNGGLILASRTSTTSLSLYDDGVSLATTATSTAETTGASPFFVFARNGPTEYYNGRMAAYSIGAGLSDAEATSYYTALNTFQTALSRNQA